MINMNKTTLIAFFGGILLTLSIFISLAVLARLDALKIAWQYPEVVADLKVSREFQVKK